MVVFKNDYQPYLHPELSTYSTSAFAAKYEIQAGSTKFTHTYLCTHRTHKGFNDTKVVMQGKLIAVAYTLRTY